MKRSLLILILSVILSYSSARSQTSWVVQKADDQVSVKFPAKPVKKTESAYTYANKDSTIVLILEIHADGDGDPSETSILDDFFKNDGNDPSVMPSDQKFDTGKWNGHTTVTSSIKLGKRTIYNYSVIINGKGYMLGAMLTGNASIKTKDEFFSSIKLNK